MLVTIEIPDDIAEQLVAAHKEPSRAALEALLVEGYRAGRLTSGQIKRALGYGTRMQVHQLLKDRDVPLNYGIDDLEQDRHTMQELDRRRMSSVA